MADCRVRRTGEDGLNGNESNSEKQMTRSCTHCSSSCIHLELHSAWFILEFFSICQGIVSCSDSGLLVHISAVNQEVLFILENR